MKTSIQLSGAEIRVGEKGAKSLKGQKSDCCFEAKNALQQFLDVEFILKVNWRYESHAKELF